MHARFATVFFAVGIAGIGNAGAADYGVGHSGVSSYSVVHVARAPQLLIYDNEPGVYVRAYWTAPWQNRRYFPFTGKKPKVGRHERLTEVRPAPPPAETFYREWSTISLYPPPPRPVIVHELPETPLGVPK